MQQKENFQTITYWSGILQSSLAHVPFTSSKRELDILYKKPDMRVVSRVVEWLKTWELKKY